MVVSITTLATMRAQRAAHPILTEKAVKRTIAVRISYEEINQLWDAIGEEMRGRPGLAIKAEFPDIGRLAMQMMPDYDGGRQGKQRTIDRAIALIERIYCMHELTQDEDSKHFSRWCRSTSTGVPMIHRAMLWAAARATLHHNRLRDQFYFDPQEMIDLCHQGEIALDMSADTEVE